MKEWRAETMQRFLRTAYVVLVAMVLGGLSVRTAAAEDCEPLGCGLNGGWVGGNIFFHELDAGPEAPGGLYPNTKANDAGVKIVGFRAGAHGGFLPLGLVVHRDELIGVKPDQTQLKRQQLIGSVISLSRTAPTATYIPPSESINLIIKDVQCTNFWTDARANELAIRDCSRGGEVPIYRIEFVRAPAYRKPTSLCGPESGEKDPFVSYAVIYRGDRYNVHPPAPYIKETGDSDTWFNIACMKTALAKIYLNRHALAAQQTTPPQDPNFYYTTVAQRATLLRMITGDYCGTGRSFTENGHPLGYSYKQPWPIQHPVFDLSAMKSFESFWDEKGAVCVDVPRLTDKQPDIWMDIKIECTKFGHPFRRCHPRSRLWHRLLSLWHPDGYVTSANPPPSP